VAAKRFKAIAAMSENRVIGNGPKIPWHLPEDFKFFKATTTGHIVVMGRATFESIGKPLPRRETIIVSRSGYRFPGTRTVASLDEIDVNADERDVFICGGAQIYALALPRCSDLFLTHVKRVVEGDVFFPPFEDQFIAHATLQDNPDFRIVHYLRRLAVGTD
jgi:dihydrofolate reductase